MEERPPEIRAARIAVRTPTTRGEPIADALLAYLRRKLDSPGVSYAQEPMQFTGGFDTEIHAFALAGAPPDLSGPLIIRLFPPHERRTREEGYEQARFEAAVQTALAGRGYPAPRILAIGERDSGLDDAFVIMERAAGRTMVDALLSPSVFRISSVMAAAHAKLHDLDPEGVARDVADAGAILDTKPPYGTLDDLDGAIARAGHEGLRPVARWLHARRPAPGRRVICHGDFHPLNIIVDRGRVTGVIDWTAAVLAEAEYDVGASVALFGQGPVDVPGFLAPVIGLVRRRLLGQYVRRYTKLRPLDMEKVRYYEALRCTWFLLDAGEQLLADMGRIERPAKPSAFAAPRTIRSIRRRLREITDIDVTMPGDR